MLVSHMDAYEDLLVALAKIQNNTGHALHKGTPRELFVREFLAKHLPETVSIGSGEIIDANSKPGEKRNQHDIIIYKNNYPKLDFGGGINGFLIESVIATIEVKSNLDKNGLYQAFKAAVATKKLQKNENHVFHTGHIPPAVLNFVIAYDGPSNIDTTRGWLKECYSECNISIESVKEINQRLTLSSKAIDGVFIMKKGTLYFNNQPVGIVIDEIKTNPNINFLYQNKDSGNLLLLFVFLQQALANMQGSWINMEHYITQLKYNPGEVYYST